MCLCVCVCVQAYMHTPPTMLLATITNETTQQRDGLALEVTSLRQQIFMIEQQLGSRDNRSPSVQGQRPTAKDREIAKLQNELQMMTLRANQAERMVVELQEMLKVKSICCHADFTKNCEL